MKRPHQSSDNKIDIRGFIDDIAVEEDGEEDVDDNEEEDPDQSESSIIIYLSFHLPQSI